MPTATKAPAKSPSAELARLGQVADKAQAKARAARSKVEAWDQETENLRHQLTARLHEHPEEGEGDQRKPKPGTEAARLRAEVRERMQTENPYQADYEVARDAFYEVARPRDAFKRVRVLDRIAELQPDADAAMQAIRAGWELLLQGCEQYAGVVRATDAIVGDTPGLRAQALDQDPRPSEWHRTASEALRTEVTAPGLTYNAHVKLANLAEQAVENE